MDVKHLTVITQDTGIQCFIHSTFVILTLKTILVSVLTANPRVKGRCGMVYSSLYCMIDMFTNHLRWGIHTCGLCILCRLVWVTASCTHERNPNLTDAMNQFESNFKCSFKLHICFKGHCTLTM